MKNYSLNLAVLAAVLLASTAVAADQSDTNRLNRFGFSARVGFGVAAKFKSLGRLSLAPPRTMPNGDAFNYDDGYVLTDVSGNSGDQTSYWGYDGSDQISGDTILMHRSTVLPNLNSAQGRSDDDPNLGGELTYNRELATFGRWRFGLEAAVNFMTFGLDDRRALSGNVSLQADHYPFTPGTTPPIALPTYQGSYEGPGFVIGATPTSSTTLFVPNGATITGQRKYDADIWGFRLGPYAQIALCTNVDLTLSAGLAAGLVCDSASWNETINITGGGTATSIGRGSDTGLLLGGYASAKATWHLSERWSLDGGVQFQSLGVCNHSLGGRKVELDLSKSIFIVVGLGYSF
jgi:hypothetical protein